MPERKGSPSLTSIKRVALSRMFATVALVLVIAFASVVVYFIYPFGATNFPRVGQNRAAILDALWTNNPNPTFENETVRYLIAAGLSVDVYRAPRVTVEFMKSFPAGYELVIFRVHSATSRHGVFYFTNEPYDESKYAPEQFRDELRPGKDYEGHPPVFAFGSKFVDAFLQDRFQNAIVVGMGCFGAGTSYGTEEEVTIKSMQVEKGPNLASAFYRQGAIAAIGWDSLVSLGFSDQATLQLIQALTIDRLTVSQATEKVNRETGPDPIYKSSLTFYPEQNGDKSLNIELQQTETLTSSTRSMFSWIRVSYPAIWNGIKG